MFLNLNFKLLFCYKYRGFCDVILVSYSWLYLFLPFFTFSCYYLFLQILAHSDFLQKQIKDSICLQLGKCCSLKVMAPVKNTLVIVFSKYQFPKVYVLTVFENYVAYIEIDDRGVELESWDAVGQADYDRPRPLSYPDSYINFDVSFLWQSCRTTQRISREMDYWSYAFLVKCCNHSGW